MSKKIEYLKNGVPFNPKGVDFLEEDWDNLAILDACRYDYFVDQSFSCGNLESRISKGASSAEFIRGNFSNKELHDVVYVCANGHYGAMYEDIGAEVHEYIDVSTIRNGPDGITTMPETVTQYAIEAAENYPNKRLIIHYLQPHQPYIGEFGQQKFDTAGNLRDSMKNSDVSAEDVREAYRENLAIVLEDIEVLLQQLSGKTVVTSDHGEMLGEEVWGIPLFGHFAGLYREELIKVPWQIIEGDERRKITSGEASNMNNVDPDKLNERLKALGYKK